MKVIFFSIVTQFIWMFAIGQPQYVWRSNSLNNAVSASINSSENKWVHNNNIIIRDNLSLKRLQVDREYEMSKTNQSFINIHTRKMESQGKTFYIIFVDKWSGHYKYPEYSREWMIYRSVRAFIFSESEFLRLNSESGYVELKTHMYAYSGSMYSQYNEVHMLNRIVESIKTSGGNKSTFVFPIKFDGNSVKFNLPESSTEYAGLDNAYFEIDRNTFNRTFLNEN